MAKPKRPPMRHETRITLYALAGGLPAVIFALLWAWSTDQPERVELTVTLLVIAAWIGFALAVRERVIRPLQTLSNLMAALREGDYSIRARGAHLQSPLGLAFYEVNALADSLRRQRLDATEAVELLRSVMEQIDVAIFAFDPERRLQLVNRGGQALLATRTERALGLDADALGLASTLEGETPRLVELGAGRWELRRGSYRWEGRPHQLVVLSDLTRSLREEERMAWQRLVRVLSHEINNSLTPIKSIAGSLRDIATRPVATGALQNDLAEGLGVIESRAEALGRFIQAYARLAQLPRPVPREVGVPDWVRRVATLETRVPVEVTGGPVITLHADGDQLDALLINLVRNAADAALETHGGVRIGWQRENGSVAVRVEDDGPGIADTSNLFVPFFTTKPEGTGIGLSLCRQIAEAHGGTVTLTPGPHGRGAVATVRLPLR